MEKSLPNTYLDLVYNHDEHKNLRLCGNQKETIQHIIASCPNLSTSMYLPLRHNKVADVNNQNIVSKEDEKCRQPIQEFYYNEQIEIWWDTKNKTLTTVQHNKPDIVMWKKEDKQCLYHRYICQLGCKCNKEL